MGSTGTSARTQHSSFQLPTLPAWAGKTGWESDVVISTRARLARNLAGVRFPDRALEAELKRAAREILAAARAPEKGQNRLCTVDVSRLSAADKAALVDRHLISVKHAMAGSHRWALVDDHHTISVMVNEEDHLRLQAILPGLQLESAWSIASQMDDQFAEQLDFAFDPKFGYLTSSLTNCGTGLRLSVMVHLPGLALTGNLDSTLQAALTLGSSVRGFFGEGSLAAGSVYQISNAVSTGKSERQLIVRLAATAALLVTDEQAARELLWQEQRFELERQIESAESRLKLAERLTMVESMDILSQLRLGSVLGLSTGVTSQVFNELMSSLHLGAQYLSGEKAHYTFYEETRRPALMRNKIRENTRNSMAFKKDGE